VPSKTQERIYAEKAIRLLGWNCQLKDISEPPDFEVNEGSDAWGLEVRNIFKYEDLVKGSWAKEQESRTSKLLLAIARDYYDAGGSPIALQISGFSFLEQNRTAILAVLQNRKARELLSPQRIVLNPDVTLFISDLPVEFSRYNHWQIVDHRVGWARSISQLELQQAINAKAEKLMSYQTKYQRIDLLLVADRIFNSLLLSNKAKVVNPGFSSIYFLSYPEAIQKVGECYD